MNRQQIKLNKLKIEKETAELKKLEQIKSQGEQLRSNGIKYEMKYYITNVGVQDPTEVNLYI